MDLWANAPSIICGHVSLEPLSYYTIIIIQWLYEHRATTLSLSYHMVIHWTNGPYSLHYDHMNHLSLLNCHCVNVLLVGLWAYHTTDHTLSSGSLPRWPCLGSYLGLNLLLEYMISIRSSQSHSAIEYVSHSVTQPDHWSSIPSWYPISLSGEPLLAPWSTELVCHQHHRTQKLWVYAQSWHLMTASGLFGNLWLACTSCAICASRLAFHTLWSSSDSSQPSKPVLSSSLLMSLSAVTIWRFLFYSLLICEYSHFCGISIRKSYHICTNQPITLSPW